MPTSPRTRNLLAMAAAFLGVLFGVLGVYSRLSRRSASPPPTTSAPPSPPAPASRRPSPPSPEYNPPVFFPPSRSPKSSPRPRPTPAPPSSPGSTSVELIDAILEQLNWGNIAFNAPSTMRYRQPRLVELLLSPSLSISQLQAQLEEKVGAESARVRISNRMEAQLTGSGFAIEATTPGLQAITSGQASRWKWEVVPTEHGRQRLHLVLSAHIDVATRDTPFVVRTFDRMIEVEITVAQRLSGFVQKNWQWLWAAVLVPIVGYLWRRWKKRPHEPNQSTA